jgi:hypothetical protein
MGLYSERCYVQITVTPRADYGSARASRIVELGNFLREIAALDHVRIGTCKEALAAVKSGELFCRQ